MTVFEESEKIYRPMTIGCFAKNNAQRKYFFNSFLENNRDIVKKVQDSYFFEYITLKDDTRLIFMCANDNKFNKGYNFDQLLLYNMLATDLPDDVINNDLINYYLPEEFHKYQIMYYEDD